MGERAVDNQNADKRESTSVGIDDDCNLRNDATSLLHHPLRALRQRAFRTYWLAQGIAVAGAWMFVIAQAWLVLELTNSAFALGATSAAGMFPLLLLAVVGGRVADLFPKPIVLMVTNGIPATLMFLLAWLVYKHYVSFWHILVIATIVGASKAFEIPTRHSFIPELAPQGEMLTGLALHALLFNMARVIGALLAGIISASHALHLCFLVSGITRLAPVIALARIVSEYPARKLYHRATAMRTMDRRTVKFVAAFLCLIAMWGFLGAPYRTLLPIFARDVLHGDVRTLGYLSAAAGVGAAIGALLLTLMGSPAGRWWLPLTATCISASALLLFSRSQWLLVSLLLLVAIACGMIIQNVGTNAVLQSNVPNELRGRIMGFYTTAIAGSQPLGHLLVGAIAHRLSAPLTVFIQAIVILALALPLIIIIRKNAQHPKLEGQPFDS
ncbi:MAG TPA: MFS transporter [Armatimonadetes bacterium]|nr:MFS transporter [Armatimonadota bacterium]